MPKFNTGITPQRIKICRLTAANIVKSDGATEGEKRNAKMLLDRDTTTLNDYFRMQKIAESIMRRTEKRY